MTVVLYHTVEGMNCFLEEGHSISMMMYVTALLKFFATSFGGILIGIIYGALTSVLTKYTVETRGRYYHFCPEMIFIQTIAGSSQSKIIKFLELSLYLP